MTIEALASYRHSVDRIASNWPAFVQRRNALLLEQERFGHAAERATERILDALFTEVLDWEVSDLNHQVGFADLLVTRLGVKYLIIEAKRPGALAWNDRAVEAALEQARRYADEQKVHVIAVSDGAMLYAADVAHGGLRDRVYVSLMAPEPPTSLWWLSVHGVYRPIEGIDIERPLLPRPDISDQPVGPGAPGALLHHKYRLPASCFAYVGDSNDPATWHLPYRLVDGSVDAKRLPKAIESILSNYRGAKVTSIPEKDIEAVLARLADAATSVGKMPSRAGQAPPVYQQLAEALAQVTAMKNRYSG